MKKQNDGKKGEQKPRNILRLLGFKKGEAAAAPLDQPPTPPKQGAMPPEAFDADSMMSRYRVFEAIQRDATEFPQCRDKLLDAVIANEQLYGRYICDLESLKALMAMRPNQKEHFIKLALTNPECQYAFLTGFHILHRTTEGLREYKDKIMELVFSDTALRNKLIFGINNAIYGIEHFPEYKTQILDWIVNDPKMVEKCTDCSKRRFFAFCKEHTEYTARFVEYVFTSDLVYRQMIHIDGVEYFMEQFPEYADRLINFILSSYDRFSKEFVSLDDIYKFEKRHPKYANKLIDHALSLKKYVQDDITAAEDIVDLHSINPTHAKKVLAMALADDEWTLGFLRIPNDLVDFLQSDFLRPVGERCLALIYINPNKFESIMYNKTELNKIIAAAPKDHEAKLRLYYQLYAEKLSLIEVINQHCTSVETVYEFQSYLLRNIATIKPTEILHLRDHITKQLQDSEISAEMRAALTELQSSLVNPEKAELRNRDKLQFIGSSTNATIVEQQEPDSPPKGQSFG